MQYMDIKKINNELKPSRPVKRSDDDFDLDKMKALADSDEEMNVTGKGPVISSARESSSRHKKEMKKPLNNNDEFDLDDLDALEKEFM